MSNIKLPIRFKEKIELDQSMDAIVKTSLSDFGEILDENKLFFFGEYTDHGKKHIERVLASSENLITNNTFVMVLETNDICYYTLAVLLHDIGMHLSMDGFLRLIKGDFDEIIIKDLDMTSSQKSGQL